MGAGLPYGQLAQNAMLMAAILRLTNTITTTTDALNAQAIVINNLQARLEASFEVTIAQRVSARCFLLYMIGADCLFQTELSYIIKKLLVLDGLANAGTYCSIYIAVQVSPCEIGSRIGLHANIALTGLCHCERCGSQASRRPQR